MPKSKPVAAASAEAPPPLAKAPRKPRSQSAAAAAVTTTASAAAGPLKVLFVASECAPYAKTGGLGDVVAGLAKQLRRAGHDVRVVLPLYASVDRGKYGLSPDGSSCVHMGRGEEQWVGVQVASLEGEVPVWFVEYDRFFGRPGAYHEWWGEYQDNAYRFALLSKAALQLCKDRDFIPDVMHAHDWQSALVPVFLKTWDRILSPLSATASVLTIHNIGFQGVYNDTVYDYLGIGREFLVPDIFEDHGNINLLKAGIHFADAITTVSPTHAREITEPGGGQGLAPYLNNRRGDLFGILNGVDYEHWDPAIDPMLPARYRPDDLSGKAVCKTALQQRFGLEGRPELPVIGIVSRFAAQKGFDLLVDALPRALDAMLFQLVVLGSGDAATEEFFGRLTHSFPGRVGCFIGFSNELSHLIEAGSDFFLMPSHYEPCGLTQSYSMKYGTLPIVRATGGLDDTVINYEEAQGTGSGFKFWDATPEAVYYTIGWAISTWYDRPPHIARMRRQAMALNYSWDAAASQYARVYRHAMAKRRGA